MRGLGLIIYGDPGIGKTSFGFQFPHPLRCISVKESGFADLDDIGEVPSSCENVDVTEWSSLLQEIRESSDVKTLVVDSLSGVWQLMKDDILKTIYRGADNPQQAFGSFSEGARVHGPAWAEKLETACTLLRSKGVNIILLGHTKVEKSKNIMAADYQSAVMDLESWPRAVLTKWAQAVLYMQMDFDVRITKKWKGTPTEAKVSDSMDDEVSRVIYTSKHPSHDAKNRLNLPTSISMGESAQEAYNNFLEALPQKIKENLVPS